MPALVIGRGRRVICALAVRLKFRLRYDDSLDVLGVHGVGGLIGMVLLGCFATHAVNPAGANGLFMGGGLHFFGVELLAAVVAVVFSFGVTWVIAKAVDTHHRAPGLARGGVQRARSDPACRERLLDGRHGAHRQLR